MSLADVSTKPLIYIAGGLTKADDDNLMIYGDIRQGCTDAGFNSYLPHEDTGSRTDNLDPNRVFVSNIAAIDRSVAVVADVNVASHGVGIEIEHAYNTGKPIIAVAHQNSDVSRMLLGHPGILGEIQRYSRRSGVPKLVRRALDANLRGRESLRKRLISLEGPDFVGKSSVFASLVADGQRLFGLPVAPVTDPPWALAPWGDLEPLLRSENLLSPIAEALLFGTARVDSYARQIRPNLDAGKLVICDRFIDSWFAYQSVRLSRQGRSAPLEFLLAQHRQLEAAGEIESPGLTVLLMATTDELRRRGQARGARDKYEDVETQAAIIDAYEQLAARQPYRIVRIETTGRSADDVLALVTETIAEYVAA